MGVKRSIVTMKAGRFGNNEGRRTTMKTKSAWDALMQCLGLMTFALMSEFFHHVWLKTLSTPEIRQNTLISIKVLMFQNKKNLTNELELFYSADSIPRIDSVICAIINI